MRVVRVVLSYHIECVHGCFHGSRTEPQPQAELLIVAPQALLRHGGIGIKRSSRGRVDALREKSGLPRRLVLLVVLGRSFDRNVQAKQEMDEAPRIGIVVVVVFVVVVCDEVPFADLLDGRKLGRLPHLVQQLSFFRNRVAFASACTSQQHIGRNIDLDKPFVIGSSAGAATVVKRKRFTGGGSFPFYVNRVRVRVGQCRRRRRCRRRQPPVVFVFHNVYYGIRTTRRWQTEGFPYVL
mmetsp:Transcript_11002/g.23323  ORF Transcript_11002/g.23323 Transcript_11002/m.23323 type:complete len:238 (+) Transcript_11002:396-1109(+)